MAELAPMQIEERTDLDRLAHLQHRATPKPDQRIEFPSSRMRGKNAP
jgi:hypothetical protein